MSAMPILPLRPGGWTVDDLDLLPDDPPFRYELVDGGLLMTPPPGLRHDECAMALLLLLSPRLPAGWRALAAPGVYFDRRNYRQPDAVVYRMEPARSRGRIEPGDVELAVEVVSPSSVSTDRVAKPAQYAAAGIRRYWRLELDPLTLAVHALDGATYRETARFTDEVTLDDPVRLRFRLADLLA